MGRADPAIDAGHHEREHRRGQAAAGDLLAALGQDHLLRADLLRREGPEPDDRGERGGPGDRKADQRPVDADAAGQRAAQERAGEREAHAPGPDHEPDLGLGPAGVADQEGLEHRVGDGLAGLVADHDDEQREAPGRAQGRAERANQRAKAGVLRRGLARLEARGLAPGQGDQQRDRDQPGDRQEQPTPADPLASPDEQAAADQHPDLVADDLRDVAPAELVDVEQIDGEAVDGDVHRRGEQVGQADQREQQRELLARDQRGRQAGARERGLQRDDPAAPPTEARVRVAVDEGGPQGLEQPRRREGPGEADVGQRDPARGEVDRQGRGLKAEGQALNDVEDREDRDLPGQGRAGGHPPRIAARRLRPPASRPARRRARWTGAARRARGPPDPCRRAR